MFLISRIKIETDFTIIDNEKCKHKVYKAVLCMIPYFNIMFNSSMEESKTTVPSMDYSTNTISTFFERFTNRSQLILVEDFNLEYFHVGGRYQVIR